MWNNCGSLKRLEGIRRGLCGLEGSRRWDRWGTVEYRGDD